MNTPARLVGFSVILAAALGAGYGAGAAAGPLGTGTPTSTRSAGAMVGHATTETVSTAPATGPTPGEAADAAGGGPTNATLGANATGAGYALVASSATVAPGPGQPFAFTITGPDAAPVTAYTEELHLLGVRRDGGGYQHVHPARDASGQWHAMLDMSPGPWRLIADTVPAGASARVTLVMDVAVTGDYTPTAPTQASTTATVADYTVTLTGSPTAGVPIELAFTVTRTGVSVNPEPYLGGRGHVVAVREGALDYLHVHSDTDALSFTSTFPTPGRYRLFLDILIDGQVCIAPFTVDVI